MLQSEKVYCYGWVSLMQGLLPLHLNYVREISGDEEKRKVKFGIYGCRHFHLEIALTEMLEMGHECVGIYEPEGSLAKKLAEKYGIKVLNSAEAFFQAEPEMALCSSVNSEKIDRIEECCARGIHIMLDKPLVSCQADYDRLLKAMESGAQIGLMLTERFSAPARRLKELVDEGVLGDVVGLYFSKPHKLMPENRESWHFDKTKNGGPVIDLSIHDLDLMRWVTGSEIKDIMGIMKVGDRPEYPDLYDDVKMVVEMENGVTGSLMCDWWTPDAYPMFGDEIISCTGTKGRCVVHDTGDPNLHKEPYLTLCTENEPEVILTADEPKTGLMKDFLDRINGLPCIITQEDVLLSTKATLDADKAVKVVRINR